MIDPKDIHQWIAELESRLSNLPHWKRTEVRTEIYTLKRVLKLKK